MGKEKKHKRHKSDRREKYDELPLSRAPTAGSGSGSGSGLRLVLKVGVTPEHEPPPSVAPLRLSRAAITEAETQRKEKKHKKKKKKDKERDREHRERHRLKKERRHLESAWSGGLEDSSRLSSGTEPLSQGTTSSPEPASVPSHETDRWGGRDPSLEPPPEPLAEPSAEPATSPARSADPYHGTEHDRRAGEVMRHRHESGHGYEPRRRHESGHGHLHEEHHGRVYDSAYATAYPPHHDSYHSGHDSCPTHTSSHSSAPHSSSTGPMSPTSHHSLYAPPREPLRPPKSSLQRFLEYLLRGLEKKDTQRFFRAPVTDLLAPGYSNVIRNPMDFSTMLRKIEADMYSTLAEFQSDFRLMCSNAMAYNRADTIYFKAAKRLLHIGTKMMAPEKLASLRTVVPAMLDLTPEVLGFEVLPPPLPASAAPQGTSISSLQFSAPDPVDEEAQAEEILKQAQEAARRAAEKVANSKKAPKLGFLRRQADGSTTMAILTPSAGDGEEGEREEKTISLGVMTGRLSQGLPQLPGFREDRRNQAKPVKPVYYGIYGSYGPWYDSAFATISKDESELLAQTYGDETARQYAQSVRQFSDGCSLASRMVDNLLDILTDGRHRQARPRLHLYRQLAREERLVSATLAAAVPTAGAPPPPQPDLAALRSLAKLGIDVGFVDALEAEERRAREAQSRLEHTSELLASLSELQRRRLSQPASNAGPAAPSQRETELAAALAGSLASMVRQNPPGDVVGPAAVRRALGVGPTAASPDNPSSHEEVDVEAVSTAATPEVRPVDTPPTSSAPTPSAPTPGLHELLADV